MKSALFVDFDNVFTQLRALLPDAAERFARQPLDWIHWLINTLEVPEGHAPGARRRLLVRRCYLNPVWYQRYRHAFLRAGFEIVDCPPVTAQGKTSTDIHMVLDIIELLQHETRYDEFIVLSADADFTPVLRKLRRYDRRTTVLAIGFPSSAYQASADLLIDERLFIEQALGMAPDVAEPRALADALPAALLASSAPLPSLASMVPVADVAPPAAPASPLSDGQLADIVQRIESAVAQSTLPVPAAALASRLRQLYGPQLEQWNGHTTFKPFFKSLGLGHLVWLSGSGGRIADPARHAIEPGAVLGAGPGHEHGDLAPEPAVDSVAHPITRPIAQPSAPAEPDAAAAPPDPAWSGHERLLPLVREVSVLTGAPALPPQAMRAVIDALCADLAAQGYEPTETARRVRHACLQRQPPLDIALRDVIFLLRGMQLNGHQFGRGQDDAHTLAQRLFNQMLFLCQREQMVIDEAGQAQIRQWIGGGLLG